MNISLRNLSPAVEAVIVEISHREGISLNKATLWLLEAALHQPAFHSDFDEFPGKWSNSDAGAFDAILRSMRQFEPVDWKLTN